MTKRASARTSSGGRSGGRRRSDAAPDGAGQPIYRVKAEFFRVLGHPARVRILEILRDGERSVGELQVALGSDSSTTSQHLGTLRKQGLLESRRAGTRVLYWVKDPRTFQLLEVTRQILTGHFEDGQALLDELTQAVASARTPQSEPARSGSKR